MPLPEMRQHAELPQKNKLPLPHIKKVVLQRFMIKGGVLGENGNWKVEIVYLKMENFGWKKVNGKCLTSIIYVKWRIRYVTNY